MFFPLPIHCPFYFWFFRIICVFGSIHGLLFLVLFLCTGFPDEWPLLYSFDSFFQIKKAKPKHSFLCYLVGFLYCLLSFPACFVQTPSPHDPQMSANSSWFSQRSTCFETMFSEPQLPHLPSSVSKVACQCCAQLGRQKTVMCYTDTSPVHCYKMSTSLGML